MNCGDYRKKDQIYSKWRNVNKIGMEFNTTFSIEKRQWQSGENDEIMLQKALALYRSQKGTNFKFLHVWNVVKMSKKWQDTENSETFMSGSSKRTNTSKTTHNQSSDAHVGIDLNEEESIEVPIVIRLMSRDQTK
ncbi:glutathione S-transferase T2-like [Lactuca sativa]|uniref:glutathione S-transferase T2-like n=1 Tax=Lactuca sativa TaxID=4236 RepID=UPI000CD9796D|nr:glutathione S-transferase T2-like [Lactuca sativa]